jgi:hypothetical protein
VLCTFAEEIGGFYQKQYSKDHKVDCGQGLGESLVITSESSKSGQPSKGTLYDPATREKNKPAFCFFELDDEEVDSVFCGCMSRFFPSVSTAM